MKSSRPGPGEALLITANRLLDGRIVWRDHSGKWREDIRQATPFTFEEAESALETAEKQAQQEGVVGIYDVLVRTGSVPQPVTMREHVRAFGPTVNPDFAYVAASSLPVSSTAPQGTQS
ncbi:DUF2849 domain-containing protein [Acetobacteraceae bacterium ESL0709]|nr:DUF2849 domain-containing protein [Acetobacteraceae bacterium ESL0697]MDF7678507.1 DUF2849 domain-containing protein [Acetobacteraceae bacterium ESL0709]